MSIQIAREELERSIRVFAGYKSEVAKQLESAKVASKEQLELVRENFNNALKDLNRTHTIWWCRYEEQYGCDDLINDEFSTSWLESQWYEYSDLDDELDEILFSFSTRADVASTPANASSSSLHAVHSIATSDGSVMTSVASCDLVCSAPDGSSATSDASSSSLHAVHSIATSDGSVMTSVASCDLVCSAPDGS